MEAIWAALQERFFGGWLLQVSCGCFIWCSQASLIAVVQTQHALKSSGQCQEVIEVPIMAINSLVIASKPLSIANSLSTEITRLSVQNKTWQLRPGRGLDSRIKPHTFMSCASGGRKYE